MHGMACHMPCLGDIQGVLLYTAVLYKGMCTSCLAAAVVMTSADSTHSWAIEAEVFCCCTVQGEHFHLLSSRAQAARAHPER